ncbi:MAG: DNA/RNA helicase domain-containing protein, partial [bacterium]
WFLNDRNDVRSSFYLEETATEFDIQGLELDWTIICWDANLRFNGLEFEYYNFLGTKWNNVRNEANILYLKNAYRVLLTRARQGFIIFIPNGDENDKTMLPAYYDGVYSYLKNIGIEEI